MKVLHFTYCFFEPTQTFIYHLVSHHQKFTPILVGLKLTPTFSQVEAKLYELSHFPTLHPYIYFFPIYKTYLLSSLLGVIQKEKPSLLHAHFGVWGYFLLPIKKKVNIPLVVSFYGYDVNLPYRRKSWRKRYSQLFTEGDLFLVEGEFMRNSLVKLGAPREKIRIQKIGINLNLLKKIPKMKMEKFTILFAASLLPKKGVDIALKSILKLKTEGFDFQFVIIGKGKLLRWVKKFIKINKMSSYTTLLSHLPYSTYLEYLNSSNIFLQPSKTAPNLDTEGGAPTTLLEAQALGIPIVTTFHADIPNVVLKDETALLSQEGKVEGVYRNLKLLIEKPEKLKKMKNKGMKFIEEEHNVLKTITKLETHYLSLLKI